jgi:hypothetical protein
MKQTYDGASIVTILIEENLWAGGSSRRYVELTRAISAATNAAEREASNSLHAAMLR